MRDIQRPALYTLSLYIFLAFVLFGSGVGWLELKAPVSLVMGLVRVVSRGSQIIQSVSSYHFYAQPFARFHRQRELYEYNIEGVSLSILMVECNLMSIVDILKSNVITLSYVTDTTLHLCLHLIEVSFIIFDSRPAFWTLEGDIADDTAADFGFVRHFIKMC